MSRFDTGGPGEAQDSVDREVTHEVNGERGGDTSLSNDSVPLIVEAACANPQCDEVMTVDLLSDRRDYYHTSECRKAADESVRLLASQIEHHQHELKKLQARCAAYERAGIDVGVSGPRLTELIRAREAVNKVGGMANFLQGRGEFGEELLDLYNAVEPIVRKSDWDG